LEETILARIERSINIGAPPEKIWSLIFWDKVPQWFDTVKKAEYTTKFKDRVGAVAHVSGEAGGVKAEWDAETTEWIENVKYSWRTTAGNFTGVGSMKLSPIETGIKATFIMDYDLPYSILGKIIDKIRVSKDIDQSCKRGLEKLREISEKKDPLQSLVYDSVLGEKEAKRDE
jgi:uncharacterized membrane protein